MVGLNAPLLYANDFPGINTMGNHPHAPACTVHRYNPDPANSTKPTKSLALETALYRNGTNYPSSHRTRQKPARVRCKTSPNRTNPHFVMTTARQQLPRICLVLAYIVAWLSGTATSTSHCESAEVQSGVFALYLNYGGQHSECRTRVQVQTTLAGECAAIHARENHVTC